MEFIRLIFDDTKTKETDLFELTFGNRLTRLGMLFGRAKEPYHWGVRMWSQPYSSLSDEISSVAHCYLRSSTGNHETSACADYLRRAVDVNVGVTGNMIFRHFLLFLLSGSQNKFNYRVSSLLWHTRSVVVLHATVWYCWGPHWVQSTKHKNIVQSLWGGNGKTKRREPVIV
jgi:hypothetical protein